MAGVALDGAVKGEVGPDAAGLELGFEWPVGASGAGGGVRVEESGLGQLVNGVGAPSTP